VVTRSPLWFFLWLLGPALAQAPLSLSQVLAHLDQTPAVQSAEENLIALQNKLAQLKAEGALSLDLTPALQLAHGVSASGGRTSIGPSGTTLDLGASLTLNLPLPLASNPNALAQVEALAAYQSAQNALRDARNQTLVQLMSLFDTVLLDQAGVQSAQTNLEAALASLKATQAQVSLGAATALSLEAAQNQIASARAALDLAEKTLESNEALLVLESGLHISPPFPVSGELPSPPPLPPLDRLLSGLNQRVSSVLDAQAQLAVASLELKAAQEGLLPTVTLSASYLANANNTLSLSLNTATGTSSLSYTYSYPLLSGPGTSSGAYQLSLGATIPLLDGGAAQDGVRSAQATLVADQANLLQTEQAAVASLRQSWLNALAAYNQWQSAQANLRLAQATLAALHQAVQAGTASPLQVTQQEAALASAEQSARSARLNADIAYLNLELAAGLTPAPLDGR
jgi:outer membrane protein